MKFHLFALATGACLFAGSQLLVAQEKPAPPAAEKPAEAKPAAPAVEKPAEKPAAEKPPAGDAFKAWEKSFAEWKEMLVKLRDLREKYQQAEDGELDTIRKQYSELLAQGEKKLAELRETGLAAYQESPNADRQLTRFVIQMAANDIKADNYQAAADVCKILIANKCEDKQVYNLAGIAAFNTNNFDAAEEYFTKAKDLNAISEDGDGMLSFVPQLKELWVEEQKFRTAEAKADDLPRVKLKTSQGDIVLELFENEAPDTVGNFISLVENGFYDGRSFHRVLPGFMAQTGCPKGDGSGDPGYKIYCEVDKTPHRNHFAGTLSMAKANPKNTGGSQFFMTFVPRPQLNDIHTVFGRVIEGQDVLSKIHRIDPDKPGPKPKPDTIIEAEVLRKRDHEYKPHKVS